MGAHISTIGVDFQIKTHIFNDTHIKLQLWETAGKERFRAITSAYYRSCDLVFLIYDITNRESFNHLNLYVNEITTFMKNNNCYCNLCAVIIGNKLDLKNTFLNDFNTPIVTYNEALEYCHFINNQIKFEMKTNKQMNQNCSCLQIVFGGEISCQRQLNDSGIIQAIEKGISICLQNKGAQKCNCCGKYVLPPSM